jgi:hypothetical protein
MPTFVPRARRALAFAGLTGALAAPATITLAAGTSEAAGPPALSPVSLSTRADSLDVISEHLQAHLAETRHDHVVRRTLRTARHAAHVRGDELPHGYRTVLDRRTNKVLKAQRRRLLEQVRASRERQRTGGAPAVAIPAQLSAIAACESGGDPQAIGGGGAFRGKYQFTFSTWAAVGGHGDPATAPEAEQDRRAAMLYAQAGAGQWPVCGR